MHIHFHANHNLDHNHPHDRPSSRVTRDLGAIMGWFTGPGMTERKRVERNRAEALNERYGRGLI